MKYFVEDQGEVIGPRGKKLTFGTNPIELSYDELINGIQREIKDWGLAEQIMDDLISKALRLIDNGKSVTIERKIFTSKK